MAPASLMRLYSIKISLFLLSDVCPTHPDNDSLDEKCLDISPLEVSLSSTVLSCFQNYFNFHQNIPKIQVSL